MIYNWSCTPNQYNIPADSLYSNCTCTQYTGGGE
jgi:hypothetical protein